MRKLPIALITLFAFGCTTVRVPASSLGDQVTAPRGAVAQPQVELWLESGGPVGSEELEESRKQVEAALAAALDGREIAPDALGAADPLLLLRARAVARTPSRRSDQRAATVGMVVGFVVVVAAVVAIVILSKNSPRSTPRTATPAARGGAPAPPRVRVAAPARASVRPRPGPALAAPALRGARPAPAPAFSARPAPAPPAFRPAPAPAPGWRRSSPGPNVWIGFDLVYVFPPQPCCVVAPYPEPPYAGAAPDEDAYAAAPGAPDDEEWTRLEEGEEDGDGDGAASAPRMVDLAVPPAPELHVASRGFFARDETVLELDLFDRATGGLIWSKVVRDGVDPRDARAVTRLVDRALAGQEWATPPVQPAAPQRH
jgi:hypothetical protein